MRHVEASDGEIERTVSRRRKPERLSGPLEILDDDENHAQHRADSEPPAQTLIVVAFDIELRPAHRDARQKKDSRVRQREGQRWCSTLWEGSCRVRLHGKIEITEQQI